MEISEDEKAFDEWFAIGGMHRNVAKPSFLAGVKWERQRMGELGSKVINRMVDAGSNLIKSEAKLKKQLAEKDKTIEKLRECVESFECDCCHLPHKIIACKRCQCLYEIDKEKK